MDKNVLYVVDLNTVTLDEVIKSDGAKETASWIHALPLGEYSHPIFGKMKYTADKIRAFADSVKTKVRGIDPSINYIHGVNGGDGEAAGWVKDADARPDGLWVFVEWTKDAAEKIKTKAWRYFSAEYQDKWTDAQGKEHADVFFGGALTNRPYMKNLLPINLTETTVDSMLGLAELITAERAKAASSNTSTTLLVPETTASEEVDVDLKKYIEALGLPAETTEAELLAKLSELKPPGTAGPIKPAAPVVPKVNLSEELTKLAEENPMVKALIDTVDAQNKALTEHNVALREADVDRRLAEFDRSKIVLTPAAKDLVHDFAMDLPVALTDRFWEILEKMRTTTSMLVELGERAGNSVRYGRAKDPVSMFMDTANSMATAQKITLSEAMEQLAKTEPTMYNEYRNNSYSFRD